MQAEAKKLTMGQNISMIIRGLKLLGSFPRPLILSTVLSSVFDAVVPFINLFFAAEILNELAGMRSVDRLTFLVVLTVTLNLIGLVFQKALARWKSYCGRSTWQQAYKLLSDKALSMDYDTIENPAVQAEFAQVRQNQWSMGFGLVKLEEPVPQIVQGIVRIAISTTLAFTLFTHRVMEGSPYAWLDSPWIALAILLVLAGPVLIAPYINSRGGKVWLKYADENNKSNRFFNFYFFRIHKDSIAAKDIRIYDQRRIIHTEIAKEQNCNWRDTRSWGKLYKYESKYSAAGVSLTYLCNGIIFLFVALKAMAGAFGVGSIVLYVGAITQFGMGFSAVLTMLGQLVNNNPFLEAFFKLLDMPNTMAHGSRTTGKGIDKEHDIEFRNVSFKYPGTEEFALKNLSLKFSVGKRLAIVGENGSGKTTLVKLLCRLYDPDEGEILLNGVNIKEYDYSEYMSVFSIVFQDFSLLPFTLGQNVAVSAGYDEELAKNSLVNAGFGERLESMPNGLDTYLYKNFEEDGVEISGGEAQKIALARALYRNSPFIILDEPTAALDPIAEFEVYNRMNEIVGDKTAVFISHRLSSCRFCSDIAVFHEGRLIQRGSHDELLLDTDSKYYELWNAQAQYYQVGNRPLSYL